MPQRCFRRLCRLVRPFLHVADRRRQAINKMLTINRHPSQNCCRRAAQPGRRGQLRTYLTVFSQRYGHVLTFEQQSGYLTHLSQELANEQAQPQVRMAAGLALKNSFSAREYTRLRQVQDRWLSQVDPATKQSIKALALQTLKSNDARSGQSAAQFIASIAAIEIPREQWPELMPTLVQNVGEGADHQKQASLTTIGFICEAEDQDLRDSLSQHSNAILTAVVQGARKEEANPDVRNAAITALGDSLEFVRTNFDNEGERNYIMQVICEATQADDNRIQQGAYGCLNRIMGLYYDKMRFYMEKALFGLTIQGMKNDEEDVAKLAVEFWCTVCEEEISIEDDNSQVRVPTMSTCE